MITRGRAALLVVPAVLFLIALFLYPVIQLLWLSAVDAAGALSTSHYRRLWTAPVYVRVIGKTLEISAWTTLISLAVGYPAAMALAAARGRAFHLLMFAILLPFWTNFLVRTLSWIVLLGRRGVVNETMLAVGLWDAPAAMLYTMPSVLVGMAHAMVPLAVLTMFGVMQQIPPHLPQAAATLGARPGQAFWRVYFPLSMPGVAAAGLLVFISSLGFFIAPALLGSPRETMIAQLIIQQIQELLNWGFAGAVSMFLLLCVLAIVFVYDRAFGLATLTGAAASTRGVARRLEGARAALGLRIVGALGNLSERAAVMRERVLGARRRRSSAIPAGIAVALALTLPSLVLVPVSFSRDSYIAWPPSGFSLRWYAEFFASPQWIEATFRSLWVGVGASLVACTLGVPAALWLAHHGRRLRFLVFALILAPLILPRIIYAIGLFFVFARIGLVGHSAGLVLGHAALAVPYVVIAVLAVLKHYDRRLDQAALTLGAKPLTAFRKITLPLISAGVGSGFLFSFMTSFDELTIALFITVGFETTLPKKMWDEALHQVSPGVTAISTMLLAVTALVLLLGEWLRRRRTA